MLDQLKKQEVEKSIKNQLANQGLLKTVKVIPYKCPLCSCDDPHMVIILKEDGDIHVHAPFDRDDIVRRMVKSILVERKKWKKKNKKSN